MERHSTLTQMPCKQYQLDKLTMVFSFYLTENFEDNRYNKIHGYFFEKYSALFDEVRITILTDDPKDTELTDRCKKWFVGKVRSKDVLFRVRENTMMCESAVFMEEIASKMDELYGLYFFAHNKGVSIYTEYPSLKDELDAWVAGLWHLSLEYMDEVKTQLIFNTNIMYGPFFTDETNSESFDDGELHYAGTFFWINPSAYVLRVGKNMPLQTQRGFAESFPKHIPQKYKASHLSMYIKAIDWYSQTIQFINGFFNEDELTDFNNTLNNVKEL